MNTEDFARTYLPLSEGLYRAAFLLLGSQEEAEDAVQDLFIKLWNGRDGLEAVRNPRAWSHTLLRNLCIDRMRSSRGTRLETVPDDLPDEAQPEHPEQQDRLDRIRTAIRSLPPDKQEILRLRLLEGLSYEDIARQTGLSPVALRVSFHRIKNLIKKKI